MKSLTAEEAAKHKTLSLRFYFHGKDINSVIIDCMSKYANFVVISYI